MTDVVFDATFADLEFECVMPTAVQHFLGLGDVRGGVAAGKGPEYRNPLTDPATQQLAHRQIAALALRIEQRRFDRVPGKMVTRHQAAYSRHGLCDAGWIAVEEWAP